MSVDISELPHSPSSMEASETSPADYRSNVDNSRPFRSVKEAVAIFGERLLAGEIAMPLAPQVMKPPGNIVTGPGGETFDHLASDMPIRGGGEEEGQQQGELVDDEEGGVSNGLKKLEADLEETKKELRILKERESETEIALAALNAELHKSMSRLARAEAVEAKVKAVATRSSSTSGAVYEDYTDRDIDTNPNFFPTIAQILSIADDQKTNKKKKKSKNKRQGYCGGALTGPKKEKPIVPLVGDLFAWMKKTSDSSFHNPLYSSSHFFN